jgi:uncharacterized protein YegP (UPF0339 family)
MYYFEQYEDKAGYYRWRLAYRKIIVAASTHGFRDRVQCQNNAKSTLQGLIQVTGVLQRPTYSLQYYGDALAQHRWRLVDNHGEIICAASEGFASKANAQHNVLATIKGLRENIKID